MQAKRFIAADMRRALDMVKNEFGEDAMILSTERTAKGVELVATVEASLMAKDPILSTAQLPEQKHLEKAASKFQSVQAPSAAAFSQTFSERDTSRPYQQKGLASGKTRQELAEEMELANRKMLAAKRAESASIEDWADVGAYQNNYTKTEEQDRFAVQKNDEDIQRLHEEITNMRQTLEFQLSQMADIQRQQQFENYETQKNTNPKINAIAGEIRQQLSLLGLTNACNDQLMSSIGSEKVSSSNKQILWTEVLAELARNIPSDVSDQVVKGGVYAFLGTTGVGKTTTIAKLAARHVMVHGPQQLVLVTTDTYRIASHNQLKSLAKILNVEVKVVEDLQHLPLLLKSLSDRDLILIDTPGMGYSDPLLKSHLQILQQCSDVNNLLVLSANSQYQMMKASLHSYRIVGLKGCVLTKLDECTHLGDALSMLSEHRVPLTYITDGQSVPDDISVVKSSQLVSRAVNMLKQYKKGNSQMQKTV